MALVGVIGPGVVARIFKSVSYAKADVLVLFGRDGDLGHVLFEKGQVVTARVEDMRDQEAIDELLRWQSGHYSLVKRGRRQEVALAQIALLGLPREPRCALEEWLGQAGYDTSVIGHTEHAIKILSMLLPDVIVTVCPKTLLGQSCSQLRAQLAGAGGCRPPPLIIALDDPDQPCDEPEGADGCVRRSASVEELERLLEQEWPGTRFAARRRRTEQTARIAIPRALIALREQYRAAHDAAVLAGESDGLSFRDMTIALAVLLVGSALIWGAWWVLSRG